MIGSQFPGWPFVWDDLPLTDCTYMVLTAQEFVREERRRSAHT